MWNSAMIPTPHLAHTLGGCHVPYTWKFSLDKILPSPTTFVVHKFINPIKATIILSMQLLPEDNNEHDKLLANESRWQKFRNYSPGKNSMSIQYMK